MGTDNGVVAIMRFVRGSVVVHRGERVVFRNPGMGAPHTVTFGREPPPPDCSGRPGPRGTTPAGS